MNETLRKYQELYEAMSRHQEAIRSRRNISPEERYTHSGDVEEKFAGILTAAFYDRINYLGSDKISGKDLELIKSDGSTLPLELKVDSAWSRTRNRKLYSNIFEMERCYPAQTWRASGWAAAKQQNAGILHINWSSQEAFIYSPEFVCKIVNEAHKEHSNILQNELKARKVEASLSKGARSKGLSVSNTNAREAAEVHIKLNPSHFDIIKCPELTDF